MGSDNDGDTIWLKVDVVHYTDEALRIQLLDDPEMEVWIPRDQVLDYSPGDVEVTEAEEIEIPLSLAERKELV